MNVMIQARKPFEVGAPVADTRKTQGHSSSKAKEHKVSPEQPEAREEGVLAWVAGSEGTKHAKPAWRVPVERPNQASRPSTES